MKCPICGNEIIFKDNDSSCEYSLSSSIICNKCRYVIAKTGKDGKYNYWNDTIQGESLSTVEMAKEKDIKKEGYVLVKTSEGDCQNWYYSCTVFGSIGYAKDLCEAHIFESYDEASVMAKSTKVGLEIISVVVSYEKRAVTIKK